MIHNLEIALTIAISISCLFVIIQMIRKTRKIDTRKAFRKHKKILKRNAFINGILIIIGSLMMKFFSFVKAANLVNESINLYLWPLLETAMLGILCSLFVMSSVYLGLYVYVEAELQK